MVWTCYGWAIFAIGIRKEKLWTLTQSITNNKYCGSDLEQLLFAAVRAFIMFALEKTALKICFHEDCTSKPCVWLSPIRTSNLYLVKYYQKHMLSSLVFKQLSISAIAGMYETQVSNSHIRLQAQSVTTRNRGYCSMRKGRCQIWKEFWLQLYTLYV